MPMEVPKGNPWIRALYPGAERKEDSRLAKGRDFRKTFRDSLISAIIYLYYIGF